MRSKGTRHVSPGHRRKQRLRMPRRYSRDATSLDASSLLISACAFRWPDEEDCRLTQPVSRRHAPQRRCGKSTLFAWPAESV